MARIDGHKREHFHYFIRNYCSNSIRSTAFDVWQMGERVWLNKLSKLSAKISRHERKLPPMNIHCSVFLPPLLSLNHFFLLVAFDSPNNRRELICNLILWNKICSLSLNKYNLDVNYMKIIIKYTQSLII